MRSDHAPDSEAPEYLPLPESSPERQAALELNEHAVSAKGRLALGCCMFWLSNGGYLLTALPPMGDVCGHDKWMAIYTAEHFVRIEGANLHLLAWAMKQQRVDNVSVTADDEQPQEAPGWVITSITARARDDD